MNGSAGPIAAAILTMSTLPAATQWLNVPTKGTPRTKLRPFKRMPTGFEPEISSSMLHYPRSPVFIDGYLFFRLEVHHE